MTIKEFITKFSDDTPTLDEFNESIHRLHCACTIGSINVSQEIETEPDLGLNVRDRISINIQSDDGVVATYRPSEGRNWNQFIQAVMDNDAEENARLIIDVSKVEQGGRLSIYNTDDFAAYMESMGVEAVLNEFDSEFNGKDRIVFEVQTINYTTWNTSRIAFIPLNGYIPEMTEIEPEGIHEKRNKICDTNVTINHLTPSRFMPRNEIEPDNRLQAVFRKYAQMLCFYFLFNHLYFSRNEITYKMIGLRAVNGTIDITDLRNADIDCSSLTVYLSICDWLYTGGNIYDKTSIARNVLSLNINEETLTISSHTHDAVVSNFNIYEMENMKHYLEVRNKVSDEVGKIQKDIIGAIEEYTGGVTKVMTANLTFFLTTVIIRVLAKNIDNSVLLPNVIIFLSYALIIVSLLYLLYSRYDARERKELKENHFKLLKNRYSDVLGEEEITILSSDFDENKEGSTALYVKNRMKWITWLWVGCLSVITLAISGILIHNLATQS